MLASCRQHAILTVRFALPAALIATTSALADTEIHRCLLDDGTFAFQETPCLEPRESGDEQEASVDDVSDPDRPFVAPADAPTPVEQSLPNGLAKDRAACEKAARDAIDAIDLQMRETDYSEKQGQLYLAELLELTRQLRACKQL